MLLIPAAHGDVLDRLSILAIKLSRINRPEQRANVQKEYQALLEVWLSAGLPVPEQEPLYQQLFQVNEQLWEIEDQLRFFEAQQCFDAAFIALARQVYQKNDRRAHLKRKINELFQSPFFEEKLHPSYPGAPCL